MSILTNGHFDKQRDLISRHFDKVMLFRLILVAIVIQLVLVWISSLGWDSTRVLNILTRVSDNMSSMITGCLGALYILMRANEGGTRSRQTDAPPKSEGHDAPSQP